MHVVDNVSIAALGNLPLVRLQFSVNAFGAARRQEVIADVAVTHEIAERLIRALTDAMEQVRRAESDTRAASEPRGSVN